MKNTLAFATFALCCAAYAAFSSALNTQTAAQAANDFVVCKATPTGVRCVANPIKD